MLYFVCIAGTVNVKLLYHNSCMCGKEESKRYLLWAVRHQHVLRHTEGHDFYVFAVSFQELKTSSPTSFGGAE